ncbi:MAG: hypothetical protein JXA13_13245 [Anaerolineales bacterium]|nr:hypothetical protein [Anaerolineales bacterium]
MGKYQKYQKSTPKPRPEEVHPIWRGIGCFIGILVPLLSYGLAVIFIDIALNEGWAGTYIPHWMFNTPFLPRSITSSRYLYPIFFPLLKIKHLYGLAIFTILFSIILYGFLSLLYAILYRFIGPSRYSPIDAPPPNIKVKRYKR